MWPKWWVHISQRRTLQTKRKKEKKNIHLWIFRWDQNKLHYNLWICALRWPYIGRGVFSCSEFTFQNMLLSLNDRREWNKTQIHVHAALDAPEFGRVHDQRLGNSRWCGIWKKERIRLYFRFIIYQFCFVYVPKKYCTTYVTCLISIKSNFGIRKVNAAQIFLHSYSLILLPVFGFSFFSNVNRRK